MKFPANIDLVVKNYDKINAAIGLGSKADMCANIVEVRFMPFSRLIPRASEELKTDARGKPI